MEDNSKFKRLLVTGGAGFIGSEYVRSSLSGTLYGGKPEKITVVDSLTYAGNKKRLSEVWDNKEFAFVQADVRDQGVISELLDAHDVVIHFAAESHVDRSIENSQDFIETNVLGTHRVLHAAREFNKTVVLISTDEVYGSINEGAANEQTILNPSSPYSASKASADLLALSFVTTYGLDVRVTRCVNNYGKYQDLEKLIPKIVHNLRSGLRIPLYGNGLNVRDWIHTKDHCDAIARVLHIGAPGEIYNVGGDESYSNIELAYILLSYFNLEKDQIEFVQDRLGHDMRYSVDSSKIKSQLDWKPRHRLTDSISEIEEGIVFLS